MITIKNEFGEKRSIKTQLLSNAMRTILVSLKKVFKGFSRFQITLPN